MIGKVISWSGGCGIVFGQECNDWIVLEWTAPDEPLTRTLVSKSDVTIEVHPDVTTLDAEFGQRMEEIYRASTRQDPATPG